MMDFAFWPYKFNFHFFFFNSQSLLPTIMSIHCQSQTNKPFFSFFFFFFQSLAFPLITHLAQNSNDYLDMWCKIRLKLKKSGTKPRLGIRGRSTNQKKGKQIIVKLQISIHLVLTKSKKHQAMVKLVEWTICFG